MAKKTGKQESPFISFGPDEINQANRSIKDDYKNEGSIQNKPQSGLFPPRAFSHQKIYPQEQKVEKKEVSES